MLERTKNENLNFRTIIPTVETDKKTWMRTMSLAACEQVVHALE